jgi:hypothetical protein
MSNINLTKKAVGDRRLLLSENGEIVSNGHWACKRAMLKQAPLLCNVEAAQATYPKADVGTIPDDHIAQIVPKYSEPITYSRTQWASVSRAGDAILFVGSDDESQIWINRTYVDLFDLESVKAPACPGDECLDPGVVAVDDSGDWDVIVMPMRIGYQEGLK